MFIPLQQILILIGTYKYFIIFPLAVVEGPIITILSGFLASLHQLDFFVAYLVLISGDLVGDCLYYFMGVYSRYLPRRLLNFLGLTTGRIIFIENQFKNNPKKLFSVGKTAHGIGPVILFASGLSHYPFKKFIIYNFILTIVKSYLLLLIGFYSGRAYLSLNAYLDYGALISAIIFIILYILFLKYSKLSLKYEDPNLNR